MRLARARRALHLLVAVLCLALPGAATAQPVGAPFSTPGQNTGVSFAQRTGPGIVLAPSDNDAVTIFACAADRVQADGTCAPEPDGQPGDVAGGTPPAGGGGGPGGRAPGPTGTSAPPGVQVPVRVSLAPDAVRSGIQRVDYGTEVFSASGGAAPYRFTLGGGQLPGGLSLSDDGALRGIPVVEGVFEFTVKAADANGVVGEKAFRISIVAPGIIKAPPAIDQVTITSCPEGQIRADGSCGPDDIASGGPAPTGGGGEAPPTGSGTPATPGIPPVATADPAPQPPQILIVLTPRSLRDGRQRIDYGREVLAASGGTGPYSFAVSQGGLPTGLTLTPDGALSGTPLADGKFGFTVAARDAQGNIGQQPYTVAIIPPGGVKAPPAGDTIVIGPPPEPEPEPVPLEPLALAPDTLPRGTTGTAYGPREVLLSGGTPPYTTVGIPALPPGLIVTALDAGAGVRIDGTPLQAGAFEGALVISAVDARGVSVTTVYRIDIDDPLSILPEGLPTGTAGVPYGPVDVIVGGGVPPYTSFASQALPQGMTVSDLGQGRGVRLQGTPGAATRIDNALVLNAVDASGAAITMGYALEIVEAACPDPTMYRFAGLCTCREGMLNIGGTCTAPVELMPPSLADGTKNTPYPPVQLIASGAGPYSFTLAPGRGTLPGGMTLLPNGILAGTPSSAGQSGFTVEVRRGDQLLLAQDYVLAVADVRIDVSPSELPGGNVAVPYTYELSANGGRAPYSFSFSGTAPGWLTLTGAGLLSGVPETQGTVPLAVIARDANGNLSQEKRYSINVEAALCPYAGMTASLSPGSGSSCVCKPTLYPFASGNGCGPCADGQKPFGGTCPPALGPVTPPPQVTTRDTCTGGMVLGNNGVCGCPASKPRVVNGVCQAAPVAPPPPTVQKPTAPAPTPASGCRAGDAQFASEAALRSHLQSLGGGEGYIMTSNGNRIFCGPAGRAQAPAPQPQPQPPTRPAPPPQQGPTCNANAVAFACSLLGLGFDSYACDCAGPVYTPEPDYPDEDDFGGDDYDEDYGDTYDEPQSCEASCAEGRDVGSNGYYACIENNC
ncbi:Ig domain-containing protein [Anianabacter salinae]|uniref:Ig domain-containing protein n=1 Tax=Anianabacter salinae TaxID=2851023 RepID=UPI00225E0131|nr:Ig domain-containing protein [Anianabacter salinae]MBV0913820.1 Ig domain-containing protein [Anianabacter salinae]